MKYDVLVVGCGPAGARTARLLAEQGHKVLILEEHNLVGEPVRCAGLISERSMQLAGASKDIIQNRLMGASIISPQGTTLDISTGKVQALAVDRAAFDRELAVQAQNAGAELHTGARVRNLIFTGDGYKVEVEEKNQPAVYNTRLVIGADGANSTTARLAGLQDNNPAAVIYSAEVKIKRFNEDMVDVFVGQDLAPGWFGWIIPLGEERCRVGTGYALCRPEHTPRYYFEHIVNKFPGYFKDMQILKYTGGVVPLGMKQKIYAPHLLLVGDAANQVKPISGGGVYPGLRGAQLCAETAGESLRENNLTEHGLVKYQLTWEKEFGKEIQSGISYRERYLNLNDNDIDQLIKFLSNPYWRNIISKYGDIDYPSWLSGRLFNAGPWVKKFLKVTVGVTNYTSSIKSGLKNVFT
ncbi:MAG: NAD(P)/FAD-dependent oxidoreductase [Clostridiales bacterium]|nr:NAD(P)/FAD-dependent oxidoreductase [Clostridiales bacterium]MCF8022782.1 NAD(P)/FAD-dependent oxidoreductase [Clostridiales bacterium]